MAAIAYTKFKVLQERIAELESQLAASQARECRMREAMQALVVRTGCLGRSHFHYAAEYNALGNARCAAKDALSTSAPCPHAADAERLMARANEKTAQLNRAVEEMARLTTLNGELSRALAIRREAEGTIESDVLKMAAKRVYEDLDETATQETIFSWLSDLAAARLREAGKGK